MQLGTWRGKANLPDQRHNSWFDGVTSELESANELVRFAHDKPSKVITGPGSVSFDEPAVGRNLLVLNLRSFCVGELWQSQRILDFPVSARIAS